MKKRLICVITALVMALSCLSGCTFLYEAGFLKVDYEKAYYTKVATVTYNNETKDVIRGELLEAYANYGSSYSSSGYDTSTICTYLVSQLANQKLMLMYGAEQGISESTLLNAEKNYAYKTVNDSLRESFESYLDAVKEEYNMADDEPESNVDDSKTARALPEIEEETFSYTDYVSNDIEASAIEGSIFDTLDSEIENTSDAKLKTIKKVALSRLKSVIEANYYRTYDEAYEYMVSKQIDALLVTRIADFIKTLSADELATIPDKVQSAYDAYKVAEKKAYDKDSTALYTKVENYDEIITYVPVSGYGEVKNILIKFSDSQSAELTAFKGQGHTDEEYIAFRNNLATEITVNYSSVDFYDWFENQYDEDDYTDDYVLYDWRDVVVAQSGATLSEISISTFITNVKTAVNSASDKVKAVNSFIYGYGEDTGMMNADNDYVISPVDSENSWVAEFTELGQALCGGYDTGAEYEYITTANLMCEVSDTGKVGAMGWVVTDYGVHIIYVTKEIDEGVVDDYIPLGTDADEDSLYSIIYEDIKETMESHKTTAFENKFFEDNEDAIVTYPENWADLLVD